MPTTSPTTILPTTVQRVIAPRSIDPSDVRPLYLDESGARGHVHGRTDIEVPASTRLSFATYFNAFPASYWKRWTRVTDVALRMQARGVGRVDVYRSNLRGETLYLDTRRVANAGGWADGWHDVEFAVSLATFEDGGWIWFDVAAEDQPLRIRDAVWATEQAVAPHRLVVGMTTMRADDCVTALLALGEEPIVLDVIEKVIVVDQGAKKVRDNDRYPAAVALLGDKLEVIEQDNLGGSGGFARVMYEAMTRTDAESITLMDDDIVLEPHSLLRAATFAGAAKRPVIVGSHMFDLQHRTRLLASAEIVDLSTCLWRTAPGAVGRHDFAVNTLKNTLALHRRHDAGYNGWWTCTIPRAVVETTGLPLPLFIKWDDAEYSLRAAEHGFPTVSLPTSAIWHLAWGDKNDTTDWQAYFHTRNRLITAALHSPPHVLTQLIRTGLKETTKNLLCMQYSTVVLAHRAVTDFLAGPEHLFASLRTALPAIQQERAQHADTKISSRDDVSRTAGTRSQPPHSRVRTAITAAQVLVQQLRTPRADAADLPTTLEAGQARWFTLGAMDSAAITTPTGIQLRRRDNTEFRALLAQTLRDYRNLRTEWPRLTKEYQQALPHLTSLESWREAFATQRNVPTP